MRRWQSFALGGLILGGVAVLSWQLLQHDNRGDGQPSEPTAAPRLDAPTKSAPTPTTPPAAATEDTHGIAGTVLRPDGTPAEGADVVLYRMRTAWPEWQRQELQHAVTSARGEFRFAIEHSPDLLLEFSHRDFAGDLVEAQPELQRQQLLLQPGFPVEGTAYDRDGRPLPACAVALESVPADARRPRSTVTDASGHFAFANVAAGTVRLLVRHPFWQPAAVPNVVVGASTALAVHLDQAPLAVEGTVKTSTQPGIAIAGAEIVAIAGNGTPGSASSQVVRTDAVGGFRVLGLARGNLRLIVRHPGYTTVMRNLVVTPAAEPLRIELVARSKVRGALRDPQGVMRAAVNAGGSWPSLLLRARTGEIAVTEVAADGSFDFADAMPAGWANLEAVGGAFAFGKSGAATLQVRVEETPRSDLEIDIVPPGVLEGRVVDGQGRPVAQAMLFQTQAAQLAATVREAGAALLDVDLRRLSDQFTRSAQSEPERLLAVSGADGTFRVTGMPAGRLAVRAARQGFASVRAELSVPGVGESLRAPDVVLPAGCRVRGSVLRGGKPLAGAVVAIAAPEATATATAGSDGAFVLADLPPGTYRVKARFSTLPPVTSATVEARAGEVAEVATMNFPAGRVVNVEVVGSDNQPIEGALVLVRGAAGAPAATDAVGTCTVELPSRPVELQVLVGDGGEAQLQPVAADAESVRIVLTTPPTATVVGHVHGLPGRKPPAGVLVRCTPLSRDAAPARSRWVETPGGELRVAGLPTGRVRLTIVCEGFVPRRLDNVDLAPGTDHNLDELLLEPGPAISGIVVDDAGRPLAGCSVLLGDESDLDLFAPQTRTAADGSFRLHGVSTISAQLIVRAAEFATRTVALKLPADALRKEPLRVSLDRGATVDVELQSPRALDGGSVLLLRGNSVIGSAELSANGKAVFRHIAPGSYTVQIVVAEDQSLRAAVEVSPGQSSAKVVMQ